MMMCNRETIDLMMPGRSFRFRMDPHALKHLTLI